MYLGELIRVSDSPSQHELTHATVKVLCNGAVRDQDVQDIVLAHFIKLLLDVGTSASLALHRLF